MQDMLEAGCEKPVFTRAVFFTFKVLINIISSTAANVKFRAKYSKNERCQKLSQELKSLD